MADSMMQKVKKADDVYKYRYDYSGEEFDSWEEMLQDLNEHNIWSNPYEFNPDAGDVLTEIDESNLEEEV